MEVRDLSSDAVVPDGTYKAHRQYGVYATAAYSEGDVILAESPLAVSSSPSSSDAARSQFDASFLSPPPAAGAATRDGDGDAASLLRDLVLPKGLLKGSAVISGETAHSRKGKLRGMLVALAKHAADPPSKENRRKLFALYHPPTEEGRESEQVALQLAKLALRCARQMAAEGSELRALLEKTDDGPEEALQLLLVYSCNAFEGGRIYERLSRINHSCDPNAVVVEGESHDADVSVLKAACDIAIGDEICISYLGKFVYAGYPLRQRLLREDKHFACRCVRCQNGGAGEGASDPPGDLASRVPCPICHPRHGRHLDDDVMFDEADDELNVSYAVPANGETPEERALHCPSCNKTTTFAADGTSMRKKKEGMAIKYMCMAEEKAWERLEPGGDARAQQHGDDAEEAEEEGLDRRFLQMATSICGAQHWTTHFLNLSLIEETLASLHAELMNGRGGSDPESRLVDLAEAADGLGKAFAFAASLALRLDPAHWLCDYTVGLARLLVGLGDVKSMKYGSEWIARVEGYAARFENEGMNKVVAALRDAWRREGDAPRGNDEGDGEQRDGKRRKIKS